MAAENTVRFICFDNFNAPQLSNTRGMMIPLLDAALVNGLPLPSVANAVIDGTTLKITFSQNHLLKLFQVVRLSGFNALLNGDWRIISVPDTKSIVINLPTGLTVIDTIGNLTLASLGYEKAFAATNEAAYRDANPSAQYRPFLRLDETLDPVYAENYAKYAKVGVLSTMSSIDDLSSAQIPFDVNAPTKNWVGSGSGSTAYNGWAKWYYARNSTAYSPSADNINISAGNRQWMIVGDGTAFYLILPMTASDSLCLIYGFGSYIPFERISTPFFLASSLIYSTVSQSLDFSAASIGGFSTPLVSDVNTSGVLLFNDYGTAKQCKALTDTLNYRTGSTNIYKNQFVVQQASFLSETNALMGAIPHFRYLLNKLSYPQFSPVFKDTSMFVSANVMTGVQASPAIFYLGEV